MDFEARPLRIQLPCKSVTVLADQEGIGDDVELQAQRYLQTVALATGGIGFGEGHCEECSGNPSEPLCQNASEELNLHAFIDARVLPILRQQLEARLREIALAEEAIARATGGG